MPVGAGGGEGGVVACGTGFPVAVGVGAGLGPGVVPVAVGFGAGFCGLVACGGAVVVGGGGGVVSAGGGVVSAGGGVGPGSTGAVAGTGIVGTGLSESSAELECPRMSTTAETSPPMATNAMAAMAIIEGPPPCGRVAGIGGAMGGAPYAGDGAGW